MKLKKHDLETTYLVILGQILGTSMVYGHLGFI